MRGFFIAAHAARCAGRDGSAAAPRGSPSRTATPISICRPARV
ncbi:hypothetical protein GLA29479_3329 [Lysobacter antibioticus]|nr:hypothetical protein GLA29479_3329 [Lysobacter antibioticus]